MYISVDEDLGKAETDIFLIIRQKIYLPLFWKPPWALGDWPEENYLPINW